MKLMFCRVAGVAVGVVLAGMWLVPSEADAAGYVFDFGHIFSGSTTPAASPPWIEGIFQDVAGGVQFSITNVGLSTGEFVGELYFNLNPAYGANGPASLSFSLQSRGGSFDLPSVSKQANAFKADGDGYFDVMLSFSTSSASGQHRFVGGDSLSYLISGLSGLKASDFVFQSSDSSTGLYAAAHIQGISGGTSIWSNPNQVLQVTNPVSAPEPGPGGLLVLAASLWAGSRFRPGWTAGRR